jgi:ketosteroid isomerase-like protein
MTENGRKIIDLDRQRMTAMAQMDVAKVKAFLSDDLIWTHATARVDTKQSLIKDMESGEVVYSRMEPSDVKAQDFGNVVVVTGTARIDVTWRQKLYPISVRITDVWANNDGVWQMVALHSTLIPE